MSSQWPPAAPSVGWPGVPQYPPIYHQHHNVAMVPRRGATYRPNHQEPHLRAHEYDRLPNRPRPGQEENIHHSQQARYISTDRRVSQAETSSLLDWLEYRDDNTAKQAPVANSHGPYLNPHSLYPASLPPTWPTQPFLFNPQAAKSQSTQRSVHDYKYQPPYRIDKSSRYNLRQRTDGQLRPYTTGASERVIQSIEPGGQEHRVQNEARRSNPTWRRGGQRQTTPFRATPARDTPHRPVTPPPEPVISRIYLLRAHAPPQNLTHPQKLLVVLDLNGTLLAREKGQPQHMMKRPGVDALLEYLFNNHVVMVCTSATGHNAKDMVKKLLTEEQQTKLVTIRARHTFGLTQQQYATKVQIYKNLEDIWEDPVVDSAIPPGADAWSMANTVLIDDTILKAKAQPHNLIQVPQFEYTTIQGGKKAKAKLKAREEAIMKSVQEKLDVLKYQANVASLVRLWQEGEKEAPGVVDEKVDQGQKLDLKNDNTPTAAENYPTPNSLDSTSSPESESEQEYDPPDEIELVFRGRRMAGARATKGSANAQKSEEGYEPAENVDAVSKGQIQASERSPSPVTEEHFSWLNKT